MSATGLAAFLLARLAEDEAVAQRGLDVARSLGHGTISFTNRLVGGEAATYTPARALADVEAKRRIVEDPLVHDFLTGKGISVAGRRLLLHLAAVYSDHPDYQEAWRA